MSLVPRNPIIKLTHLVNLLGHLLSRNHVSNFSDLEPPPCHPGIVSMKALSRSYVWWPGINENIEKLSKHCDTCQMNQNNPQKTTPHPWIPATRAWERIHIDFAQLFDRQWLVVVDSYSKFPEIIDMGHNTKTEATIRELRKLFAVYGLPRLVVSDRGPQLVSNEMEDFLESNGIDHVSVPPRPI